MTLPLISTRSTELPTWRQRVAETINNLIPRKGSFTATLFGFSGADPTGEAHWVKHVGNVTLSLPLIEGFSNQTSKTITLPEGLRPARTIFHSARAYDNGGDWVATFVTIGTDGVMTFFSTMNGAAFTASGTVGVSAWVYNYPTN